MRIEYVDRRDIERMIATAIHAERKRVVDALRNRADAVGRAGGYVTDDDLDALADAIERAKGGE